MTTDSPRFSLGDRVVLIEDLAALRKTTMSGGEFRDRYYYGNEDLTPGATGTVIGLYDELWSSGFNTKGDHVDDVLVEWDREGKDLHQGRGLGRQNHCWVVHPDYIRHDAPLIVQEDFLAVLHGGRA